MAVAQRSANGRDGRRYCLARDDVFYYIERIDITTTARIRRLDDFRRPISKEKP
jgi:hypothetical protein